MLAGIEYRADVRSPQFVKSAAWLEMQIYLPRLQMILQPITSKSELGEWGTKISDDNSYFTRPD